MTVYRYRAVPLAGGARAPTPGAAVCGELSADSSADLRAALRRIDLQVIDVRQARGGGSLGRALSRLSPGVLALWRRHARARRVARRAELFEGLATMIDAGIPLLEAAATLARGRGPARSMLVELTDALRQGASLDEAMSAHPSWFDEAEAAMVRAGRASGETPAVLRRLAERHQRSGDLTAKLVSALLYPAVVGVVGVGVLVFLSTRTLPDLLGILYASGVESPRLTEALVAAGQWLASCGGPAALSGIALAAAASALLRAARRRGWEPPRLVRSLVPGFVRRARVARAWAGLAELVRTGVPLVESLRITAPTVGGSLGPALDRAAASIERGGELATSLADPVWFDDECRRLIEVGESSGELPDVLARLADRTHRSAARAIDRAAALLEPALILALAALIGVVVLGAVLPIVRLQEVVG